MIYLLLFTILLFMLFTYYFFQKNVLNPSFVLCGTFLVSLFFSILNSQKWGFILLSETYLIITFSLASFIIAGIFAYMIPIKNTKRDIIIFQHFLSGKLLILMNIVLLLGLYKYYRETRELSFMVHNLDRDYSLLYYARMAKLQFYDISRMSNLFFKISQAFSYISLIIFFRNIVDKKNSFYNLIFISPVFIYLIYCILSTGRTEIIYLTVYSINIYFIFLYKKNNYSSKINKKIIFYIFISFLIFIILFTLIGSMRGQLISKEGTYDRLSIYIGGSIPALNNYIKNGIIFPTEILGQNTFFGIYRILGKINTTIPQLYAPLPFIVFKNGHSTNVYTGIVRYYNDFGFFITLIIMFFLGFFYNIFFRIACKKNSLFIIMMYSIFSYPIFEMVIEERFFMNLFPLNFFKYLFFFSIFYYILLYRKRKMVMTVFMKGKK